MLELIFCVTFFLFVVVACMCYDVWLRACTGLPQLCSRFPWWIPGIRLSPSGLHGKHLHVLSCHARPDCYKCNWFICSEILSIQYTKLNLRKSKARKLSRTFVTLWTVFSFQVMFLTVEWSHRGYSKLLRKIILDNRGKTTVLPPRVCTVGVLMCCPCVLEMHVFSLAQLLSIQKTACATVSPFP